MSGVQKILVRSYWASALALLAAAVVVVFTWTPVESTMGMVQKIFYLHFPVAISALLACGVNFVASVGYLWTRRRKWDDLAASSAAVAVLLCTVVLATGMIWGREAWGQWWTWSPRLTFSLLLWLLYAAYLIIRPSIEAASRRALVCAVYGVVAFIDVPLVYLSVRLMPDIHPTGVELETSMWLTVLLWAAPVMMISAGLIAARYRLARQEHAGGDEQESDEALLGGAGLNVAEIRGGS